MKYKRQQIRKKPQARRKVVSRATRAYNIRVNNTYKSCIPTTKVQLDKDGYNPAINNDGNGKWKKEKHKQPKSLRHAWKGFVWVQALYRKSNGTEKAEGLWVREYHRYKSELRGTEPIKDWDIEKKKKWLEDHKIAKWELKHPKPISDDDLFKDEFLAKWNTDREQELSRIRAFVSSRYDKAKEIQIKQPLQMAA